MSEYEEKIKGLDIEINQKLNDCIKEIVLTLDKYFPELIKIKRNLKDHGDNYSLENRVFMWLYSELRKYGYFNKWLIFY